MEALLSVSLQKVDKVMGEQIPVFANATDDLKEIRGKFDTIKAVLEDAERKQITDESVRVWLSKLKGIALDIEDVVDEWQILSASDESTARSTRLPLTPYFKPSLVFSCRKNEVRVKEIRKRLDEIHGDRLMSSFISRSSVGGESDTMRVSSDRRRTSSSEEESDFIGRDKDKETVISLLVGDAGGGQEEEEKVRVTAIVGVGGVGKTTLAQQIFKDPRVKSHFNQALYWVYVSDVFNVMELTKGILAEVNGEGAAQFEVLQYNLRNSLKGKRYLLVLDDVWNEDDIKWWMLKPCLMSGAQGSRILVTTRIQKVAEIMNASSSIHILKGLSDDISWELFSRRAFLGKKPEEFLGFESIGREIVNKCKGVPLSIKVMGGIMNKQKTIPDWQNILESEMWSLQEVKREILPIFWLSYNNLPLHLKQCFAFCSIYERDAVMFKHELVNLWVTEGFVQPAGNKELEDIGEDYFNDLVARSMFQNVQKYSGGCTSCTMYHFVHELATEISQDVTYRFTASKKSDPQCSSIGGARHASLFLNEDNTWNSIASCPSNKLRTLFVHDLSEVRGVHEKLFRQARFLRAFVLRNCREMKVLPKAIGKLRHLRYLDLSWSDIAELPEKTIENLKCLRYLNLSGLSIVTLPLKTIERLNLLRYLNVSHSWIKKLPDAFEQKKQLRYLDLSGTKIEELPESVSNLVKLHTLNLNNCGSLKILCRGICKIVGLRRLYIENTHKLHFLPKGIGELTSLDNLSKFIEGGDGGEYCRIDELRELNSVRGRLEIQGLDISSGERGAEDDKEEERIKVLECLRPHPNLQHLSLNAISISKLTLPSWMGDPSFSNLSSICIKGFENQWKINGTMPGFGTLPRLETLEIQRVGVRKLGDEFFYGIGVMSSSNSNYGVGKRRGVAFPKLESLSLQYMHELEEWELTGEADASEVMPSLRELKVSDCPKLQLLPSHLVTATPPPPSPTPSLSEVLEASKNYCNDESKPLSPAPDHVLKPLERLHWLGQLKKLESLELSGATELTCLPDSLGQLQSLHKLAIEDCYKLESLPDSLGRLKKLKSFTITGSKKLESLPNWLGQLPSLESVKIRDCTKLKSLLDSLGRPQQLQELDIYHCPELRYKREARREDWPEISHIRKIVIDGKDFFN